MILQAINMPELITLIPVLKPFFRKHVLLIDEAQIH